MRRVDARLSANSVLDASALLALVHGEPGGERVSVALSHGSAISAANLAEVLTKLVERGEPVESALQLLGDYGILGQSLFVFPLDESRAIEVARLRPSTRAAGLSMGDRACLALARELGLPVLTTDQAWADLQLGIAVEVIR